MYPASLLSTKTTPKNIPTDTKEGVFQRTDAVLGVKYWLGFALPGGGLPRSDCGEYFTIGCLAHGYIEKHVKTCMRADCPVCRQKWAGRLAGRAENRISQVTGLGPPKHVVVSLPQADFGLVLDDFPGLRRKVYKIAKRVGVRGALAIFHPARRRCPNCGTVPEMGHKTCLFCGNYWFEWYFSPHFHLVGFGWIKGTGEEFLRSGYVVRNVGRRRSVGGTVLYQLSHAGVHLKFHTITWFGALSYNKLRVEPEPREENTCPTCGARLLPCRWFGDGEDPLALEGEGGYWVDTEGWRYTARFRGLGGF
ncbi:unnamed protein product [marine sediment metagenome]|uniref:Uncharacterized protein n=1 Tax=marine sediment metagenome TaxID=412755 RepID=X1KCR0_9ZZZZ